MRLQGLIGRDILVGLTYLDAEGQVFRQEQFHGLIEEADRSTTWVRPTDGGERRWVPTDLSAFRPAPGGTYRLRSTGRVVTNPDFLAKITIRQPE